MTVAFMRVPVLCAVNLSRTRTRGLCKGLAPATLISTAIETLITLTSPSDAE
jgi:hypothetical protein